MESAALGVKRFLNSPEELVPQSLEGFAAAHRDLVRLDRENRIVVRADELRCGKVGIVAGGGSGHEPLHIGFVGRGMLDAACPGAIFTSPVPDQILAATRAVDRGAGVLHILKNYAGDVMNFRIAAGTAAQERIEVAAVRTDDDVAVEASLLTNGRRGIGGTLIVEKIAGAAAERGGTLTEVAAVARRANKACRSFGVAFSSCVNMASGRASFELGPDEMELGIGIHGEPGRRRGALRPSAEIVAEMTEAILEDLDPPCDARLLAFVNGLGGTSMIELYVLYHDLVHELEGRRFEIARCLVGNYVTSLEMAGASITLVCLDDELLELWDEPVCAAALRWERA